MQNRILMLTLMTVALSATAAGESIVDKNCPKGDCARKDKADVQAKPASAPATGTVTAPRQIEPAANLPKVDSGRVITGGSPCQPNEDCLGPGGPKGRALGPKNLAGPQKIPGLNVTPQVQPQQPPVPGAVPPPR